MFCKKCGAALETQDVFCHMCGERVEQKSAEIQPLLRRAKQFLEEGLWAKADDYCERVLDADPENAQAYVLKLMALKKLANEEDLANEKESFENWYTYQNAWKYADEALKQRLQGYLRAVEKKAQERKEKSETEKKHKLEQGIMAEKELEEARKKEIYDRGCSYEGSTHSSAYLRVAIQSFRSIPGYRDADERAEKCVRLLAIAQEREAQEASELERARFLKKTIAAIILIVSLIILIVLAVFLLMVWHYLH